MPARPDRIDPIEIDEPSNGRVYRHTRRVQLGDGSPRGRMRLDAIARFLQDVSDEDTASSGMDLSAPWVVRRVDMAVRAFPVFREELSLSTWCSGVGARWAERRVRITGSSGGAVEAAVLWVHLDRDGRPAKLDEHFLATYAPAAGGRTVRARLQNPAPGDGATEVAFPLRFCDYDMMGHVNNAISWVAVEEVLASMPDLRGSLRAATEHPLPIDIGATPSLRVQAAPGGFDSWLTVDGQVCSSTALRLA